MIDFIKKLFKKIGWILLGIIWIGFALLSILLGLGSVAEILVKIVTITGGGSIIRGIIMTPFFIFGIVQIIRGFCAVFDADLNKMNTKDSSIWNYFYIPATILAYLSVIIAIGFWAKSV